METTNRIFFKVLPYLLSTIAGAILFVIGSHFSDSFKDLIINIAAAFLAIPILFLIYELSQKYSHRKLNKEIFDYAKMQVDRELLSILNHLSKFVYQYDQRDPTLEGVHRFLSLNFNEIEKLVNDNEYLGFQVFKKWSIEENNINNILENPFVLKRLEDEQIISIILILKSLRSFEFALNNRINLFELADSKSTDYKVTRGTDLNERNITYPDRLLLLQSIGKDKFIVSDFGDFEPYNVDKVLNIYKINTKFLNTYADAIFNLLKNINSWFELTGKEILIDTKLFRLVHRSQ